MSPRIITYPITYPPEMLPRPDEDDVAEVIVVDPETGEETIIEEAMNGHYP